MRTSSKYLISTACLFMSALPASAQSRDYWTGLYGGMDVGAAWDKTSWEHNVPGFAGAGLGLDQYTSSWGSGSLTGGLHIGYQQKFGWIVPGIEFSYLAHSASGSTVTDDGVGTQTTLRARIGNIYSLALRLGVSQDRWLAYAKGGAAWADTQYSTTNGAGIETSSSSLATGYTLGGGLEYALSSNVSVGTEYGYMKFTPSGSGNLDGAGAGLSFAHSADTVIQTWTARINYRLN